MTYDIWHMTYDDMTYDDIWGLLEARRAFGRKGERARGKARSLLRFQALSCVSFEGGDDSLFGSSYFILSRHGLRYMTYDICLTYDMWHMTYDIWHMTHMTYDMWQWHMTYDIWHMTYDIWHDIWHMTYDTYDIWSDMTYDDIIIKLTYKWYGWYGHVWHLTLTLNWKIQQKQYSAVPAAFVFAVLGGTTAAFFATLWGGPAAFAILFVYVGNVVTQVPKCKRKIKTLFWKPWGLRHRSCRLWLCNSLRRPCCLCHSLCVCRQCCDSSAQVPSANEKSKRFSENPDAWGTAAAVFGCATLWGGPAAFAIPCVCRQCCDSSAQVPSANEKSKRFSENPDAWGTAAAVFGCATLWGGPAAFAILFVYVGNVVTQVPKCQVRMKNQNAFLKTLRPEAPQLPSLAVQLFEAALLPLPFPVYVGNVVTQVPKCQVRMKNQNAFLKTLRPEAPEREVPSLSLAFALPFWHLPIERIVWVWVWVWLKYDMSSEYLVCVCVMLLGACNQSCAVQWLKCEQKLKKHFSENTEASNRGAVCHEWGSSDLPCAAFANKKD